MYPLLFLGLTCAKIWKNEAIPRCFLNLASCLITFLGSGPLSKNAIGISGNFRRRNSERNGERPRSFIAPAIDQIINWKIYQDSYSVWILSFLQLFRNILACCRGHVQFESDWRIANMFIKSKIPLTWKCDMVAFSPALPILLNFAQLPQT